MEPTSLEHEQGEVPFTPEVLTVRQPEKMKNLLALLELLEGVTQAVSGVQPAGGGVAGASSSGAPTATTPSKRDLLLQNLPATEVMQQRLVTHLSQEVRRLERKARRMALSFGRGTAHAYNQLFARIRKIQALISDLFEATREVIQRLYVRLFIDGQAIV